MQTTGSLDGSKASILAVLAAAGILATAASHAAAEAGATRQGPACDPARFKIALDVGHTAEVQGATSARGVKEYVFNLRLATEMERALKEAGFAQAQLFITHGKTHAQLYTRAERANALGVDLFVSIHHNDVQEQYKGKWEYNGETRSYNDRFSGHSLFVSRDNPRFSDSLAFGHLLGLELKARGLVYTRHHTENVPGERRELLDPEAGVYRYDHLVVLMFTKVPALLVEAGIIVNRDDELVLESPERQAVLTAALVAAVQRYCGVQQAKAQRAKAAGKRK
jgi:N-acetylmuramoyl-L-alanine amidase